MVQYVTHEIAACKGRPGARFVGTDSGRPKAERAYRAIEEERRHPFSVPLVPRPALTAGHLAINGRESALVRFQDSCDAQCCSVCQR